MKDTHFLYSIVTLALGSIFAIFVGLATGSLPTLIPREASATLATAPAKKNCECCSEMSAQVLTAFRKRNEALREQQAAYKKASELIQQYGLEEGLRRLKKSHPEIAEPLEYFIEKDSVSEEH